MTLGVDDPPPADAASGAPLAQPVAAVPTGLAALLSQTSLSSYGAALHGELRVSDPSDFEFITDEELQRVGLLPWQCRKLRHAAGTPVAPAPAAATPAVSAAVPAPVTANLSLLPAAPAGALPADVFISYRVRETGDGGDRTVYRLTDALREKGVSYFVAETALQGGSNWVHKIQEALLGCTAFIVLCSPTYGDPEISPWTSAELILARGENKLIIPVWHSGPYPPPAVKLIMSGLNHVDMRAKPMSDVMEQLLRALRQAGVGYDAQPLDAVIQPGVAANGQPLAVRGLSAAPQFRVFISYRVPESGSKGDNSVFALEAALRSRGYTVFVAESQIQGNADWSETIINGVKECHAFVVLCSSTYGDLTWTRRELIMADNLRKPLLPVWHSGPYPPAGVELFLAGMQRIPAGDYHEGYVSAGISHERVAEELIAWLERVRIKNSSTPLPPAAYAS